MCLCVVLSVCFSFLLSFYMRVLVCFFLSVCICVSFCVFVYVHLCMLCLFVSLFMFYLYMIAFLCPCVFLICECIFYGNLFLWVLRCTYSSFCVCVWSCQLIFDNLFLDCISTHVFDSFCASTFASFILLICQLFVCLRVHLSVSYFRSR